MARYNKQADIREQQARSFNERDRMICKHYEGWGHYDFLRYRADRGECSPPKSPEEYLREENPYSGF